MSPAGDASALESQATIDAEIAAGAADHARHVAAGGAPETQPRLDHPPYRSSALRHPTRALHVTDPEAVELWTPVFGERDVSPTDADLTLHPAGEPIGERIVVTGRVLDGDGRPVAHQLVELWQANAGGRYAHARDQHPSALDPHFTGVGRCLTDADGTYRFTTIKPGAYPWGNHGNAWRPAHLHFSVFGHALTQRLVTQMYFPGDPLIARDPIAQSVRDDAARERMVATYDHDLSEHEWCLGYRWDVVLTGTRRTPLESDTREADG